MTQVFLTAGFILLSKNFFVFLKSHEIYFENPEYDWKDFVIYLLENHYCNHGLKSSEYEVIASNPTVSEI